MVVIPTKKIMGIIHQPPSICQAFNIHTIGSSPGLSVWERALGSVPAFIGSLFGIVYTNTKL